MVPAQFLRRDRRNHYGEIGFICIVPVYRALSRTTCEGCTSGSLPYSPHQGGLIVADGGEHEDKVWPVDACLLQRLLGGLTTRDVGIVMIAHADSGFGSHGHTSSCLLLTYLSLGGVEQHLKSLYLFSR